MTSSLRHSLADAYSTTGERWERGPGRLYNRLATMLVDRAPVPLDGRTVLDIGAGTGAASRAIAASGGVPVAADMAWGMLAVDRQHRPPAITADACVLPIRDASVGGVVAAFILNHLDEPSTGFAEARRVSEPGSPILASSYGESEAHPVREAFERAMLEAGWQRDTWYFELRNDVVPKLATPDRFGAAAEAGGLHDVAVEHLEVEFPELGIEELLDWRFGMAQYVPFIASLDPDAQTALRHRARELTGDDPPVLRRPVLLLSARA